MKGHRVNLVNLLNSNNPAIFIDRDGVINRKLHADYVKTWEEFEFLPGVLDAFATFAKIFRHIFIVTNQQGIGKGLMSREELDLIHLAMLSEIKRQGGRVDKLYYCPDLSSSGSLYRKPNIGMALLARKDFPGVQFKHSIMVGDSLSDMQFGKRAGMTTVFITTDIALARKHYNYIDMAFASLTEFVSSLPNH